MGRIRYYWTLFVGGMEALPPVSTAGYTEDQIYPLSALICVHLRQTFYALKLD